MIKIIFCTSALFGFDLPDVIKDRAIDYGKDKGLAEIERRIVDGIDGKIDDLLDPEKWAMMREGKISIEDEEGSKGELDGQIDAFFEEYNREEEGEGQFGPADPHLLARNDSGAILSSEPISLPNPKIATGIDYIEGASRSAGGILMHDSLKKIVDRSAYAYLISLESVSPLTTSAMKQIQTWANQLNAMSIQSSELAALLTPARFPKSERASAYLYEHALASSHDDIDLVEARRRRLEKAKKGESLFENTHFEKLFAGSYDVAEKVLSLTDYAREKKDLLIALAGTIRVEEKNGRKTTRVQPAQYKKAIDYLGTGKKFGDLPDSAGERNVIGKALKGIQKKLLVDAPLSESESKLLHSTHLPIGHLIALLTQYKGAGSELALDRYASLIAHDRVLQFAEEAIRDLLDRAKAMSAVQVCGVELEAYIEQVEGVLAGIENLKAEQHRKRVEEQQAVEAMMRLDSAVREKETPL